MFRIVAWAKDDWAVCAFWVDDETAVGLRRQLDVVEKMFRQEYGISSEGELRWTVGIGVDFIVHTTSPS